MAQLRPHLTKDDFIRRVKLQRQEGYRLAYVEDEGAVRSVAGFRVMNMLVYGHFLLVDDLVTDENARSKGYGDLIFDWLVNYAKAEDCERVELDSAVQRYGAHRFYLRKRMEITSHHFSLKLSEVSVTPPGMKWTLWRQDDNGHRFPVESFPTRHEAEAVLREFEARHHKQTYWLEENK
ncbi:MAG TPA: GNAT family N-acetyltransferase [Blastocatellia bacterium]|nr:GNAT family N-acetyltransferase [Blastocatellia bacterium]